MRGLADELRRAKYAHVERERRWLVDAEARPRLDDLPHVKIEDRYIRQTRCRLRRMTASAGGQRSCKLTKKYDVDDPLARPIVTAYLSDEEHAVFSTLDADSLVKRRYSIADDGLIWSLDCFEGPLQGLELLEIEAESRAALEGLRAPSWAGAEVSFDPRYQGGALAALGLPREI